MKNVLFSNSSNHIALCSYRNQLVCFFVRISFFSYSLLASSSKSVQLRQTFSNDNLILSDFDLESSFEIFKFLLKLFNREYIFKPSDDEQAFKNSLNYLLHTNILKYDQKERKYELTRLNLRQFLFYVKMFHSVMENYSEIYQNVLGMSEKSVSTTKNPQKFLFKDEKVFTKSIQDKIFDRLIDCKNSESIEFDLEILSLNLITNSLLTLTQFNGTLKRLTKCQYEFDLKQLNDVYANLTFVLSLAKKKCKILMFKSREENSLPADFDLDFSLSKNHEQMLKNSDLIARFDVNSKL